MNSEILENYLDLNCKNIFSTTDIQNQFSHPKQHMICDKIVGNFLGMLALTTQAQHILEIGTMIGFSSIYMAKMGVSKLQIDTIEIRPQDAEQAKKNAIFFNVSEKINFHIGDALTIIPQLNHTWDLVFIDADKINYQKYFDLIFPSVKKNGNIILDNMLFYNKVLDTNAKDKNVIAIRLMNEYLFNYKNIHHVLLNIRDGIQWVIKL